MSIAVDFYTGTYQEYLDKKQEYNANALYFCTDQQIMFKGNTLIGKPYQSVTSLTINNTPNIEAPIEDILYLYDNENLIFSYKNGTWSSVFGNHICSIEHFNTTIGKVTWDPNTRLLTLPQINNGEVSDLNVNLGKDLILESGSYYDTASKTIRLKLAVPDPDDSGDGDTDGEYIDIPVGDLVDIYEVNDTTSINLTLTPSASTEEAEKDINKYAISAEVKIASAETGAKTNALVLKNTGLYVDVETYADKKHAEAKTYVENRLGTSESKTVQSILNEKVDIERGTLKNGVLISPTLNDPIDVKEKNLWTSTDYDNSLVSVSMVKDFFESQNTWGAIARISTWGDLNNNETR